MALEDPVCILILMYLALPGHQVASDCEVQVPEPWPSPYLFVPQNSMVHMNCARRNESSFSLAINLPGDPFQYRSGDRQFNDNGFYELPPVGMPTTLRLLINDTSRNNGTEIICSRTSETTLIIFEPTSLELEISELGMSVINVSWTSSGQSSAAASVAELNYSLTISYGSTSHLLLLNQSHHIFKAPPGSPPCQIYNFSVTATPVGATYTGDGCSVASFNQTMLPSLPDITTLASSLTHSLTKRDTNVSLTVTFQPATDCTQYPILNYTLEVEAPSSEILSVSTADDLSITIGNLSEDLYYSFKVVVSNSVGTVSTNDTGFYTTDVQGVTAIAMEAGNSFMVMCDFIPGSYARGCLVVLLGVHDNITVEVEQNSSLVLNVSHPLSCYNAVFAFGIQSNGSVESQAISGEIRLNTHVADQCPTDKGTSASLSVIIGSVVAVVFVVAALFIIIIFLVLRKCCMSKPRPVICPSSGSFIDTEDDKCTSGDITLYAQPQTEAVSSSHGPKRTEVHEYQKTEHYEKERPCSVAMDTPADTASATDGMATYAELNDELGAVGTSSHGPETTPHYQKTEHYQKEQQGSTTMDTASATDGTSAYAELNDEVVGNFYHTLESSRPPRGIVVNGLEHITQEEGPPPYTAVSPLSSQATPLSQAPPLYHEIGEITKSISVPCSLGLKRLKSGNGITQSVADHQYATPSLCHLPSSEENGSESLV